MFPVLSVSDGPDVSAGDAIFFRKHLVGQFMRTAPAKFRRANLHDLLFRQFAPWVVDSLGMPSLGNFISHVIRVRSKEKMAGIHALRDIAFMKNVKTVWDFSVGQYPGNPMRWMHLLMDDKMSIALVTA